METLGDGDTWPRHPRPQAREALKFARSAGWTLQPSGRSGHAFGVLRCGRDGHNCKVVVFSTPSGPRDGSETANLIRAEVLKCQKLATSAQIDVAQREERSCFEIEEDVAKVAHLVAAAERLLVRESHEKQFEASLANDDIEAALQSDDAATVATAEAHGRAAAGGFDTDPWPPAEGFRAVVGEASELHERCTAEISGRCPHLASELADLYTRIVAVKSAGA